MKYLKDVVSRGPPGPTSVYSRTTAPPNAIPAANLQFPFQALPAPVYYVKCGPEALPDALPDPIPVAAPAVPVVTPGVCPPTTAEMV